MEGDIVFAAIAVRDFGAARRWYERFFDRPPDVVAHDTEVMWQVTPTAWLCIVGDPERAGSSVVTIAAPDIEREAGALVARGLRVGPIAPESDSALKATIGDPDGRRRAYRFTTGQVWVRVMPSTAWIRDTTILPRASMSAASVLTMMS
jgi:hypothetical protein